MNFSQLLLTILLNCSILAVSADEYDFNAESEESKSHLKEDLDGVIGKKIEDMNQEELQFHYFRQHDFDANEMLDGNELVMSITHHQQHGESHVKQRTFTDDQLISIVDEVLKRHDHEDDGFMSFQEYIKPMIK